MNTRSGWYIEYMRRSVVADRSMNWKTFLKSRESRVFALVRIGTLVKAMPFLPTCISISIV